MKTCAKCEKTKPLSEFGKDRRDPTGLDRKCLQCGREHQRKLKAARPPKPPKPELWPRDPVERRRAELDYQRFYKYGVTPAEYWRMFEAQGGVCFVCKRPELKRGSMAVDHDHRCCVGRYSCGECVRALLCVECNSLEGKMAANLELVHELLAYMNAPVPVPESARLPRGKRTRDAYRASL